MSSATALQPARPTPTLARQAARRAAGVPTVSVLVGPPAAGRRAWRDAVAGPVVVADGPRFPWAAWVSACGDRSAAAVESLAGRAGRNPTAFATEWPHKTAADRERFWQLFAPRPGDDILRRLADGQPVADLGQPAAAALFALAGGGPWPGVLFAAASRAELEAVADTTAAVAVRFPILPLAVAVPGDVWAEYRSAAPDTRAKAILREGEWPVPVPDAAAVARELAAAGLPASTAAAVLVAHGADAGLVAAAADVLRAPPDAARSAAERFLFEFLESLPETAGRFELNGKLDFRFGPRAAEVDLLCREPQVAVEIDGYFHFQDPAGYRRDRGKDYELQRRGYLVLRLLADDVVPHLETIRDRILSALTQGDPP